MQYLLGFNQPWDDSAALKARKYIAPADAAKYWGEYMMPISKATGLKLVSPSTIMDGTARIDWMVEFL